MVSESGLLQSTINLHQTISKILLGALEEGFINNLNEFKTRKLLRRKGRPSNLIRKLSSPDHLGLLNLGLKSLNC